MPPDNTPLPAETPAEVEAAARDESRPKTNGVDPYAPPLPAAVRRAAARAEELQQQMRMEAEAEAGAEVEPEDGSTDGTAQETGQPPPQLPPPRQDDPNDETWQGRYRTLQGKYDHEVPQMQMHIKQLENLIASMNAAPRQELQLPPAQVPPPVEIPDEDYTTYGPDFVDSTRRWARAEVQRDLERQQRQIDELRQYHQQFTGDRVKDRVRAELNRDPEIGGYWQQLDSDPGFNAWLQDFDPFSGARRLDMLREAYAGGDAVRTGRFFKAYLHEHTDLSRMPTAASQTSPPVTPRSAPNGMASQAHAANGGYYGNGAGQVDLAAYAAPGRASNATPGPGASERRIWTNRDIQAFYEGRLKGRYRGREAEADRLERDILAAAQEGRISQ